LFKSCKILKVKFIKTIKALKTGLKVLNVKGWNKGLKKEERK